MGALAISIKVHKYACATRVRPNNESMSLRQLAACVVGRYALYREIASGGMATVYFGRLRGPLGFSRAVAIKRLHAQFARDPEFVAMFVDEARLAARLRHPNIVPTLDVVSSNGEVFLVMEYVQGESLAQLFELARERGEIMPTRIATSIVSGMLLGLHAAHETRLGRGALLNLVHRDVSPHNVLVGLDGTARLLDFGVAKAEGRAQHMTGEGRVKGKLCYMAPEQLRGAQVGRSADIYGAAVVLWEALAGRKLFARTADAVEFVRTLHPPIPPPSAYRANLSPDLDQVVLRGLAPDPSLRFAHGARNGRGIGAGRGRGLGHRGGSVGRPHGRCPHRPPRRRDARVRGERSVSDARERPMVDARPRSSRAAGGTVGRAHAS